MDTTGNVAFAGIKSTTATNYVVKSGGTTSAATSNGTTFGGMPTGYIGYSGSLGDYGIAAASTGGASAPCRGEYIIGGSPDTGDECVERAADGDLDEPV